MQEKGFYSSEIECVLVALQVGRLFCIINILTLYVCVDTLSVAANKGFKE